MQSRTGEATPTMEAKSRRWNRPTGWRHVMLCTSVGLRRTDVAESRLAPVMPDIFSNVGARDIKSICEDA